MGSHAINGVAALHSDLLTKTVLKTCTTCIRTVHNVTNGVTPRRWIALSNPGLARLITGTIGEGWIKNLENEITRSSPLHRTGVPEGVAKGQAENKEALAALIKERTGIVVDPVALRRPGEADP